ncbi:MAG: hypothetical protein GY865_01280 [candidate division Zixibacteria bacterium]|nr:hypothetical protein [candidate division Zixibacteria bacterium]
MIKYLILIIIYLIATAFATDNPHGELKFDCSECHTIESFSDVDFDHAKSGYVLEGRHSSPNCMGCHNIEDFTSVSYNCVDCHIDVHQDKLGLDCQKCHNFDGWEQFDNQQLHLNTQFPLTGRHAMVDCQSCHKGLPTGDLSFNTTRCIECHQSQYLAVNNPNHVSTGFSTDCDNCHQMERWRPALLENHEIFFPIYSGSHNRRWDNCGQCHTSEGSYQMFSCLNCHDHNQNEMGNEHNGISGYAYNSPDCYFCHPTGEAGEFGDHDAQYFPVYSGRHINTWTDCSDCHTNAAIRAEYSCISCHEHNQTDSDNMHGGMNGYTYQSSSCLSCHPVGEVGTFTDHDPQFFPIYSGTHIATWGDCSECHTNPATRSEYSCLSCHIHTETDPIHSGMNGYLYQSAACLSCHPTGEAGEFTDHDAQYFPIFSGMHNSEWSLCTDCHNNSSDRSIYSCIDCHEHNQTDSDNMHGGMSGYQYESATCLSCHPNGTKGQFTGHDPQFFPIFSGKHGGEWSNCETCHTVVGDRTTFSCFECHKHSRAKMDDKHLGKVDGYDYNSDLCYDCHSNGESGD